MKIILAISIVLMNFTALFAQIGINTDSPQGVLHINPKKDISIIDDITITSNGNLGIGTISPVNKLEIIGSPGNPNILQLTDGVAHQAGYVLKADSNGFGVWNSGTNLDQTKGDNLLGISPTPTMTYTGKKITIAPGTWILRYNITWRVSPNLAPPVTTTSVATIGALLSTSSISHTNLVPGTWSFANIAYNQKFSSSQVSVYFETATTQILYLWIYWNADPTITTVVSYEPLGLEGVGAGDSNILEAIRW